MKTVKLSMLSILMFIFALTFIPGSALAAFSASDFQGTWYGHAIISGTDSDCEYSTLTVDDQGNFTAQNTKSDGTPYTISGTMNVNSAGIMASDNYSSIHGVINGDKDIMVFTNTWDSQNGDYGIQVLVKGGGSFTQSDLTGTWYEESLSSGYNPGWEYGTITIDSQGNVSINTTDSDGSQKTKTNAEVVNISSSGMISAVGNPSINGVMSPDKNFVVFTQTDTDPTSGGVSYSLTVLVKGGGSFTASDLTGTAYSCAVMAGSNWGSWAYGPITIDSNGSGTSQMTFSDNTSQSGTYTLSIDGSGMISATQNQYFHGVMNLGKNMIVSTETDSAPAGGSAYMLQIGMKVSATVTVAGFSATPLSGKMPLQVAFTDSSSSVTGWSWDFGDGTTSTDQSPTHIYSKPGKYTVSLTATGLLGSNVMTKTDYISVKSAGMSWLSILLGN